jgi:hypothetical protein
MDALVEKCHLKPAHSPALELDSSNSPQGEALVVPGAAGLRLVQKTGYPANQNFSTKVISTSAIRGVLIS